MAAAEQEVATQIESSDRSLRDELLAAREEVENRETQGDEAEKARDDKGRFARPEAETPVADEPAPVAREPEPVPEKQELPVVPQEPANAVAAPPSWSHAVKAKWNALDPDIRAEITKREAEVHKGFTKQDDERTYGREMQKVISPYEPLIRSEGGTPAAAVQDLLNTAYILRTADPQTKMRLFAQTAQRFGIDLSQLGEAQQPVDPRIANLEQRLAQYEQDKQAQQRTEQERVQQTALQTISAFKSDPKHIHFEAVESHMAALLNGGVAKDLDEAYDMAVYARPDIRGQLLASQTAQQTATIQSRQKVDKARAKAVSVRGGPGGVQPQVQNPNASLRDDLEAAFAEARGRI